MTVGGIMFAVVLHPKQSILTSRENAFNSFHNANLAPLLMGMAGRVYKFIIPYIN